jgi:hypothetical protein
LIINYTDGTSDQFSFPPQLDKVKMVSIVEKLLTSAVVSLQLKNRLLVIPTANIRSAELFPVPERLPDVVLRDVERV